MQKGFGDLCASVHVDTLRFMSNGFDNGDLSESDSFILLMVCAQHSMAASHFQEQGNSPASWNHLRIYRYAPH